VARGTHLLLVLLALACTTAADAAKVYRCGNSYKPKPRATEQVEIDAGDSRSAEQKAEADRAMANDARTAAAMEKAALPSRKTRRRGGCAAPVGTRARARASWRNPSGRDTGTQGEASASVAGAAHDRKTASKAQGDKKTDQTKPFVAKSVARSSTGQSRLAGHRRCVLGLQPAVLLPQRFSVFHVVWMHRDASHRTHLHALRLLKVTHAFGALVWIYLVNLNPHEDRLVGALRLSHHRS